MPVGMFKEGGGCVRSYHATRVERLCRRLRHGYLRRRDCAPSGYPAPVG